MTDKRTVDIEHYDPDVISNAKEFQELANAENPEFNIIADLTNKWFNNTFVYDADEKGVEQWENMLSLLPSADDTLPIRKMAILQKIMASTPYTIRKLQSMFDGGYGINEIIATEQIPKYNLD